VFSPVYRFPEPTPFTGPTLHNPYAGIRGEWRRANLHAHGHSWGGITNGEQASADVVTAYEGLGYEIAGVSNYHSIASQQGIKTLPLYEHGYNVSKRHQLAIGARWVDWLDYPLWQGLSQQQFVIDRVARTTALVGLTHPDTRDAYSDDDLRHLTGYHILEVVNGPFEAIVPWDAALSSGHPVWAMANDDSHDIADSRRTAVAWTMIDAPTTRIDDVVAALRAGRAFAVEGSQPGPGTMDVRLRGVDVAHDTVTVTTEGPPVSIEFVGQHGAVRSKSEGHEAQYRFQPHDTYIRAVIRTPKTTMFLNPVLRTSGDGMPPAPRATIDPVRTWVFRGGAIVTLFAAALWLWPVRGIATVHPGDRPAGQSVQEAD
jgi:hypothetical protein